MKKHVRYSFVILVVVVLLLAVTIPALAWDRGVCRFYWYATDEHLDTFFRPEVTGSSDWNLNGNTLTLTCTGNVPMGYPFMPWLYYWNLEEVTTYLCENYGGPACSIDPANFVVGPDEMGGTQITITYKNMDLESHTWFVKVAADGDFESVVVFPIPSE